MTQAAEDAARVAALFAVAPHAVGGVRLRARPGPARDAWLTRLLGALPSGTPWRRVPANVPDERLLGGLDLAATLSIGRAVAGHGLLAECHQGVVILAMAERISPATAGRLGAVQDQGEVQLQRDGFARRLPARFGVIALDEGIEDEEVPPSALRDRLGFHLRLEVMPGALPEAAALQAARQLWPRVTVDEAIVTGLASAALALGIFSLRPTLQALGAARAGAALAGRAAVTEQDAAEAARLVLAPRATCAPAMEPASDGAESPPPEPSDADGGGPAEDVVLAAALAALPPHLLAGLAARSARHAGAEGRSGAEGTSRLRGRPIGARPGRPGGGARLALLATLRAAAPWQRLRGRHGRLELRREDLRVQRFRQNRATTTIFAVDASGSSALHRLAEAKGAVELLLADCYTRRDRVALVAFRGQGAEVLLPPTSALTRVRRCLAGLPGGGATPLAAGLDTASELSDSVRRAGHTPTVVVLTDGRANIARDGTSGRARAEDDALSAARRLAQGGTAALLIDIAPRPVPFVGRLASAMGARAIRLPSADATSLSRAVRDATRAA